MIKAGQGRAQGPTGGGYIHTRDRVRQSREGKDKVQLCLCPNDRALLVILSNVGMYVGRYMVNRGQKGRLLVTDYATDSAARRAPPLQENMRLGGGGRAYDAWLNSLARCCFSVAVPAASYPINAT